MEDTTIEDVLKTVQALYDQKDYRGAIHLLEEKSSYVSPGLWHYNMGTLNAKIDDLPFARFHFLMAEKYGYSSTELNSNKKLVEVKLETEKYEKPIATRDYLIKGSLEASDGGIFTMLSFLLIIVSIIFAIKKTALKYVMITLMASFVFLGLNFWVQSWDEFVVINSSTIYDGPSTIFETQNEIPAGVMLVASREGKWLKIFYPSRFIGWVDEVNLKELK